MEYFRQRFIDELNDEGDIEVAGQTWTRHEVLETMDRQAEREVFDDWVGEQRIAAKDRCREFLEEYGCLPRFNAMMARHANMHVVPFVGAGMSIASGYQPWGGFLLSLLPDAPGVQGEVEALIIEGRYEEAAECAHDALGAGNFSEEIYNHMRRGARAPAGPVKLMPELFQAEVMTTNFDYILSLSYEEAGLKFVREDAGPDLRLAPQRMGNDPHCLLRLHGEGEAPKNRVLTFTEYEAAYAEGEGLHQLLNRIVGQRSLLFLGCSLTSDRTFNAFEQLKEIAAEAAIRHYAFLPYPGDDEREARREFLGRAEIHPIYYPPGDHDQAIEDLLITMMEGGFDD